MKHADRKPRKETVETVEYSYTTVFEPAAEGGYVVTVPALPGLVTEGDTLKEARTMVREAIVGYMTLSALSFATASSSTIREARTATTALLTVPVSWSCRTTVATSSAARSPPS